MRYHPTVFGLRNEPSPHPLVSSALSGLDSLPILDPPGPKVNICRADDHEGTSCNLHSPARQGRIRDSGKTAETETNAVLCLLWRQLYERGDRVRTLWIPLGRPKQTGTEKYVLVLVLYHVAGRIASQEGPVERGKRQKLLRERDWRRILATADGRSRLDLRDCQAD